MIETKTQSWLDANQRYLIAALGVVREALERVSATRSGQEAPIGCRASERDAARSAIPGPAALDLLCGAFSLSPFERDLLLLCAGPELDSSFVQCVATLQGDVLRPTATFSLALAALEQPHWSAILPASPLRRFRLIEVGAGDSLVASPLRIDERVLHYLTGVSYVDERLAGLLTPVRPDAALPPSQQSESERLARLVTEADRQQSCVLLLTGELAACRAVAAIAFQGLGLRLFAMRATDIPSAAADREFVARLIEREALLEGAGLLMEVEREDSVETARAALQLAEGLDMPVIVTSREPLAARRRPHLRIEVLRPSTSERDALWRAALGPAAGDLNGALSPVVSQFELQPPAIWAASTEVLASASNEPPETVAERLWEACRAQARPRLDDLAQRIEPTAGWDDLVLPSKEKKLLRELCAQVRHRQTVYEAWGFAAQSARGLGISALFAGQSGTGKTMAAEAIALELRLDLYRVDLSGVVNKYIGETEKNLRRIFDAAESGAAVLLFDEADALFGKRSEVKDSHDRYANIEVSYLLQRVESYRGLAILTTNLKSALDTAFLRRLRFVVDFTFPDAAARAEIWRRAFPPTTPTDGLELERLAQLSLPGGNIRNIAVCAAFLAADEKQPVCMRHVLAATRTEYAKLERTLTDIEMRGWS